MAMSSITAITRLSLIGRRSELHRHVHEAVILTFGRPWHPDETKKHVRSQVEHATVTAVTGEELKLPVGDYEVSLCCHSDSPGAVEIVKAAREIVDQFNSSHFGPRLEQ